MRQLGRGVVVCLLVCCTAAFTKTAENSSLPVVAANDNKTPAGHLQGNVLQLHLELCEGRWFPEEENGGYRDVYAFAEQGALPQAPGPLIRIPQGTEIRASIHNSLPVAAKIYGLHRHPGDSKDTINVAPSETRDVQFTAGDPGTYMYWATTSDKTLEYRDGAETVLSGAFVVDPPGVKRDDLILVLGLWSKVTEKATEEILSVNGKSWPYSQHLTYKIGEKIHWRVINPTASDHAMHLHGFYFMVDGTGDGETFEHYSEEQRRKVVTEHIDPGHAFEMTWTPEREGNWLFHCHMVAHMSPTEALHPSEAKPAGSEPVHDHSAGMGGLVIGITVLPGTNVTPATAATTTAPRKLQLVISDNPEKIPLYKLEVNEAATPPPANAKKKQSLLGPPILLTRGEPAEIEIKNQTTQPTSIHWHGIELESYYDGVAGWTGSGQQTTPPVAPGTSFVARMTPPRAGTFIYHTHWHDETQLVNGMYGPLIVLEPGQKYDPEHDKTFVFALGRYAPLGTMLLINGTPEPYPMNFQTGVPYRLRLINITNNTAGLRVRLVGNDTPVQWKVIAKDGADLPPAQLKSSVADMTITVGETYDVEYQADHLGNADLQIWLPVFPVRVTQPLVFAAAK